MMKLQETFKYLYCKIPLVDPPPITRVLLFAEFIWVGEKTLKVISFGDVCKYDWCLHKLFKTIDNFHFSTVCTMIPSNLSKYFPDRTGHVTYRKLNHVREHLNKWLLQLISLLFLQRIPDIQTIPNKSQVWPRIVKKGSHGSAGGLADTWQCLTVGCRWLHQR